MSCFYILEIKPCQLLVCRYFLPSCPSLLIATPRVKPTQLGCPPPGPADPAFGALLPLGRPPTPAVSRVSPAPGPLHVLILAEGSSRVGYLLFTLCSQFSHVASREESWRVSRAHSHSVFRKTARRRGQPFLSVRCSGRASWLSPRARRWLWAPLASALWGGVCRSPCLGTDCALLPLFLGFFIFFLMMFSCS